MVSFAHPMMKQSAQQPVPHRMNLQRVGLVVAWLWTIVAGGGGLWLLVHNGPLPLTNGWFALLSGVAACPLLAPIARKSFGFSLSGWYQFGAAAFFFIAGHVARELEKFGVLHSVL